MSGVRTFIGIPLPDEALAALSTACEAVKRLDAAWRSEKWVPTENMHITLKFVGNVDERALGILADEIEHLAAAHPTFELPAGEVRAVPSLHRARMLWNAFLDPEGRCAALAADLDRACLQFGSVPEQRTFKPHVTLVRARAPRPFCAATLEEANGALTQMPDRVSVASITLFSSRLTRGGPIYVVLRECPLGPA